MCKVGLRCRSVPNLQEGSTAARPHPRTIGWLGTAALAMGGSNQSLFLLTALFAGQGSIVGQGSAAVPLLALGLLVSYAALPGWLELVMMYPAKVGGIAAVCTDAFRPYSPLLSALAGVCYWWGWVPTCGITALLSAAAIQQWCLSAVPLWAIACTLVTFFTVLNLAGIRRVAALAIPIGLISAALAFAAMLAPVAGGLVDWHRAADFHLTLPFAGGFGKLTAVMAGLYLIGFGAPAFEAATCHVGETRDWQRQVPRAVFAAAGMAAIFFIALPVVWLGAAGPQALGGDLSHALGPIYAPLFGAFGKSAAIGFMMFNMFHGTLQPLAGAARTLSQLAEDGVLPRIFARRLGNDAPWAATIATALTSVAFLLIGDPIWLIAAANFTYLIGICMPSLAVWLLRRDAPTAERPWRAPRGLIAAGLASAGVWVIAALFGFQQFGLPTVVIGLLFAYSGAGLYAWRRLEDHGLGRLPRRSLHLKLAGSMLAVIGLDAVGYILAVSRIAPGNAAYVAMLADIFVAVALLTVTVGIVLPGVIAHTVQEVGSSARLLAQGAIRDFARAMEALGQGRLDQAHVQFAAAPLTIRASDELGGMVHAFNLLQQEVGQAVAGLDQARDGLGAARRELVVANAALQERVADQQMLTAQLTASRERAQHDATHDALTGLPNRRLFLQRMEQALVQARAHPSGDCAVLFIDLDRFKIVNDSLGHLAGNAVLCGMAERLLKLLPMEDGIRHTAHTVARLSGDEFAVLLVGMANACDAIADVLQQALAAPFHFGAELVHVTASIGIVRSIAGYDATETILRDADIAMYRAKKLGKACAVAFEPDMHQTVQAQLHMESDLRRALRSQEFELHYQPIICIATHRVIACEALVRWRKNGRLIPPGEFIGIAEETGLIIPLGQWVLRHACTTARGWHRAMPGRPPVNIAVNISARQFLQAELVHQVADTIMEIGIDPSTVTVELTESCTMGDPDRAIGVLRQLKSIGLQLSVDDFGTGYSSLSYLHRFPIDKLKVDRSFVCNLAASPQSQRVVAAILALAQGLGIRTVAEGVETAAELDFLAEHGCNDAQGYLFAKPLPAEDFERLLLQPDPYAALFAAPYCPIVPLPYPKLRVVS